MPTQFALSPDGTRIAYEVCGAGPPLMLLHGGGGSRQDWHTGGYIERLKGEFTVMAVDLRGHGESEKHTDPRSYTTKKLGQDLLVVADACGVERFILWGYSYGANVARYLAARSARVRKLILVGCRLGTGVSGEFRQFVFDFRDRWGLVVQAQLGDPARGSFDPLLLAPQDQEDARQLSFPAALLPAVLAWSSAMLDWGVVAPADLRCPTLWVIGSENTNAMEAYRHYEASLEGSQVQVCVLPGLTHVQEWGEIEQVMPVLLSFLRT
jgi:pimeloyl-ACP methyl ester carboxylesterase